MWWIKLHLDRFLPRLLLDSPVNIFPLVSHAHILFMSHPRSMNQGIEKCREERFLISLSPSLSRITLLLYCKVQYLYGERYNIGGVASRYGLDGRRFETRFRRNFPYPFRRTTRSTQPCVQWHRVSFLEGKGAGAWR
jgi:hypothetical protein